MKLIIIKTFCIVILLVICTNTSAQDNKQSAFTFSYNYQFPFGSIANTFGNNSAIGTSYFLETSKNYIFGLEGNYIFGSSIIDETIFDNINTSSGSIIGGDGRFANINLMETGFDSYIFGGYCFHFSDKNFSGIYISQGIGYLQYKILIDTKNQNIPQLNEDMKRGYDRFTNGFSTKISIDYKYYHKSGMLQISSGINYAMAYTKVQRSYDFKNNLEYLDSRSWDQLLGLKFEIIIPINRDNDEKFHYF